MSDYWEDIAFRCYRKYERLVDLLAIKEDKEKCSFLDLKPYQ